MLSLDICSCRKQRSWLRPKWVDSRYTWLSKGARPRSSPPPSMGNPYIKGSILKPLTMGITTNPFYQKDFIGSFDLSTIYVEARIKRLFIVRKILKISTLQSPKWRFFISSCRISSKNKSTDTPLKINMEHNHGGLEDHFPFQMGDL